MGLFGKKKETNTAAIMHYEGLPGFKQDFPCRCSFDENALYFASENGSTVTLPRAQILDFHFMYEEQFMGKYHNNPVNTGKNGLKKVFYILQYVSSSGEHRYIAFWDVVSTASKFFEAAQIKPAVTHTTL